MTETLQRDHTFRFDDAVPPRNRGPAQRAVADYLSTQIDAIVAGDAGLRYGADPIHDTRVAIRRVRSTLRVFATLFDDRGAAGELETDLKWFAALLGDVRDCQVQRERFDDALDRLPDELKLGPVRSDIGNYLLAMERPARGRVTDAMDSSRYLGMMAVLGQWKTEPPLDESSDLGDLRKRVKKAMCKADHRLVAAVDGSDDAALHSARKAAKRARYAGELLSSVQPKALRKAKIHEKVQSALGDHQDTMVAREVLRRIAARTGLAQGENGFTYGLLYAREQRIARETHSKARKLAKKGHS